MKQQLISLFLESRFINKSYKDNIWWFLLWKQPIGAVYGAKDQIRRGDE